MPTRLHIRRLAGSGGVTLAADVGGSPGAPPVIFLHGGGQTRHSWRAALRRLLAEGYHVLSLDTRGHGDSEWSPDGEYRLDALADDLRAVIATLPSPPALVGASLGGATALYVVGTSPTPIARALVMVDVVPRIDTPGAWRILSFMRAHPDGFANLDEAMDAVAAYNPHRPRPNDPTGLMKNLRQRPDGRLRWHWDPQLVRHDSGVAPSVMVEPLMDAARRVHVPTLLVRGLLSDVVSEEGVAELQAAIPGLEICDVAQAGHMVAGDRNDAFNDATVAFLRRHLPQK